MTFRVRLPLPPPSTPDEIPKQEGERTFYAGREEAEGSTSYDRTASVPGSISSLSLACLYYQGEGGRVQLFVEEAA